MCRISFGRAGIQVEEYERYRSVEVAKQPLVSTVPPDMAGETKSTANGPSLLLGEECIAQRKGAEDKPKVIVPCRSPSTGNCLSSTLDKDERGRNPEHVKRNLSTSESSPLSNGDGQNDGTAGKSTKFKRTEPNQAPLSKVDKTPKAEKVKAVSQTAVKGNPSTKVTFLDTIFPADQKPLDKAPPTKQVRFSNMVLERGISSDSQSDSSSNSSYDSYIDPTAPTDDAMVGLGSIPLFRRPRSEGSHDKYSNSSGLSSNASNAGDAWAVSQARGQERISIDKSPRSGSPASQSWPSSDSKSNVDLHEREHEKPIPPQRRSLPNLGRKDSGSRRGMWYNELLPEPHFITGPKEPGYSIYKQGQMSPNVHQGKDSLPPRVTKAAVLNRHIPQKKAGYDDPTVTNVGSDNDVEFDRYLGISVREV
ncbi:MAG: hypothetical protein Q9163_005962 [Psora crenata]